MQFMASFNKVMIYYLYMRALGLFFTNARIGTAFPYWICYNIIGKMHARVYKLFAVLYLQN
jgi:hypothetical protein